jgi:hypothetical protein
MNFITSLDFLGKKPTLLIKGETSNKTLFGGVLSILVTCALIAGTSYFTNMLLSRNSYSVILAEEYYPNSYIDWEGYEFSSIVLDRLANPFPDEDRIYSMTGTRFWVKPVINSDGSNGTQTITVKFPMEKCNVTRHFANNVEYWKKEKHIEKSYCIPTGLNLNTQCLME